MSLAGVGSVKSYGCHHWHLQAIRPAKRLAGERWTWHRAPRQTALGQPPDELVETVSAKEGLILEDHQRHAAVTCSCHTLGVVDPALVDFLGVLPDVVDRRIVVETVDPVGIFLYVIRPVTLRLTRPGTRTIISKNINPAAAGYLTVYTSGVSAIRVISLRDPLSAITSATGGEVL